MKNYSENTSNKLSFTTVLFWSMVSPLLLLLAIATPFILFFGILFMIPGETATWVNPNLH